VIELRGGGKATGGGQVGAPCGCIGCFDSFHNIQGNWVHQRHKQQGRFQATGFNSLVCGCESCAEDGMTPLVKLDGNLCNEGDRACGPAPPAAPANVACFSGIGTFGTNGNKGARDVAFRVEVEDHGEPGGISGDATRDQYRIWIYIPQEEETLKGLANAICCRNPDTDVGNPGAEPFAAGRVADVFDGGNLLHGNIQIHPQIAAHTDICPVPDTVCPLPLP
jgi:hypothetical protein